MSKRKFICVLLVALALVIWMISHTLSSGKADSTEGKHSVAGFYLKQPWAEAKELCESRHKQYNYEWIEQGKNVAACSIDPKKIIPPREYKERTTSNAYRHFQSHPALSLFYKDKEQVRSMFIIYMEPEPWLGEQFKVATSPDFELVTKSVDTSEASFYNGRTDKKIKFVYLTPGIDFDTLTVDAEHVFSSKERMYGIDYMDAE